MRRSEVGEVRPSQALTTFGVGSLVDLPNLSVLVMGLDDWQVAHSTEVAEERLLRSAQSILGPQVGPVPDPATGGGVAGRPDQLVRRVPADRRAGRPVPPLDGLLPVPAAGADQLRAVRAEGLPLPARPGQLRPQLQRSRGGRRSSSPPGSWSPANTATWTTSPGWSSSIGGRPTARACSTSTRSGPAARPWTWRSSATAAGPAAGWARRSAPTTARPCPPAGAGARTCGTSTPTAATRITSSRCSRGRRTSGSPS